MRNQKRQHGVYYTAGNPFALPAFRQWAAAADLKNKTVLEPFAGGNSIIDSLRALDLIGDSASFDLSPTAPGIAVRDTLADFPPNYEVCVTNPPWLARNIATAMQLDFPPQIPAGCQDIYLHAVDKCLENCAWVAAIIPESYIGIRNLKHIPARLAAFVTLSQKLFADTDHPAGLALFGPKPAPDFALWRDEIEIGRFRSDLLPLLPPASKRVAVRFNIPAGNAGLIGIDNTREASIRFCEAAEMRGRKIYEGTKFNTVMQVAGAVRIAEWNKYLNEFREKTGDVFLTSFKGVRRDGRYRKRLPFETARRIINAVDAEMDGGGHALLGRRPDAD